MFANQFSGRIKGLNAILKQGFEVFDEARKLNEEQKDLKEYMEVTNQIQTETSLFLVTEPDTKSSLDAFGIDDKQQEVYRIAKVGPSMIALAVRDRAK